MSVINSSFTLDNFSGEILAHIAKYADTPITFSETCHLFNAVISHPGYVVPVVHQVFKEKYDLKNKDLQLFFKGINEKKIKTVFQNLQSQEQLLVGRTKGVPVHCLDTYAEYLHSLYSNYRKIDDEFCKRLEEAFDLSNPVQMQLLLKLPLSSLTPEQCGKVLVLAAKQGCLSLFNRILSDPLAQHISAGGQWGLGKALVEAAEQGHLEIVKALLSHARNGEIPAGEWGLSRALVCAASHDYLTIVNALLSHARNDEILIGAPGLSEALIVAARNGGLKTVKALLSYARSGRIFAGQFGLGQALNEAAENGHTEIAQELLSHARNGEIPVGEWGLGEALSKAAEKGHLKVVNALLSCARNGEIRGGSDGLGRALVFAATNGHLEIVKALLSYARNGEMPTREWGLGEALINAAEKGHLEVVNVLLSCARSGEIPAREWGFASALTAAASKNHFRVVEKLLFHIRLHNISVQLEHVQLVGFWELKDTQYGELLFLAVQEGCSNIVSQILSDPKAQDLGIPGELLCSALVVSSMKGYVEIVNLLLPHIANAHFPYSVESIALFHAAKEKQFKTVAALLRSIETSKTAGSLQQLFTQLPAEQWGKVLKLAAREGCLDVVNQILSDPIVEENSADLFGNALISATKGNNLEVVKALLSHPRSAKIPTKLLGVALVWAIQNYLDLEKDYLEDVAKAIISHDRNTTNLLQLSLKFPIHLLTGEQCGALLALAAREGRLNIVEYILSDSKAQKIPVLSLNAALALAAGEGHLEVVKVLKPKLSGINYLEK